MTGDTEGDEKAIVRDHDVIITTPEKWVAVSRKLKDYSWYMNMIRLVLVFIRLFGH